MQSEMCPSTFTGMSARRDRSDARRKVLIAGGGVAGLETMIALDALASDRVEVELLSPEATFHYRPLDVREPFGLGRAERLDLSRLTAGRRASHRRGALAAVDAEARRVETDAGERLSYDALVVAAGARPRPALEGALTFWGASDVRALRDLLDELVRGAAGDVAFVLPGQATWPLPLYELALMTARHLAERNRLRTSLTLVTHESAPLELFGRSASEAIATLLQRDGVALRLGSYATAFADGTLHLAPRGELAAERVVALPRLEVPEIPGLPQDAHGFVPTDLYGRVEGTQDVYAAGDVTTFPIKQGGLAAQQADVVAASIAAWAGASVTSEPFRPVLRGQLLTGGAPRYLRSDLAGGRGDVSDVDVQPLWWPPGKVAGKYLAPLVAELGIGDAAPAEHPGAVDVLVEL